ncbi:MAG: FAA hydrolase family protein [Alphaproteobacteria bacterium]|nr:FAA hydrolase family protein [Alphaproteobacteria bacterium]
MKLARVGPAGAERPAIIDAEGRPRNLGGRLRDFRYDDLDPDRLAELGKLDPGQFPLIEEPFRYGPPVRDPRKLVCTGPNYRKMSDESGAALPSEPRIYMKADTCVAGPDDDLALPSWAKTAHWEVELAVVIGREARDVPEASALDHVAGYAVVNDVTDRHSETAGFGESVKGRSHDGFGPLGPWLVTKDEVPDPSDVRLWLRLNGDLVQDGHSARMKFKVPFLVSYISRFMTLRPGDILCTGTPGGVGLVPDPPIYLKPGDEMHCGIVGMGEQRSRIV